MNGSRRLVASVAALLLGALLWNACGVACAAEGVSVGFVRFSSDGRLVAAGCEDGLVQVWAMPAGRRIATLKPPSGDTALVSLDFIPGGHALAVAYNVGGSARLFVCDAERGTTRFHLEQEEGGRLVCSADGRYLANYTFTGTNLWDARTGRRLALLQGATGFSHPLAFSPDSQVLAVVEMQDSVDLWSTAQKRKIRTLPKAGGGLMAFSPDGHLLATGEPGSGSVGLWDVRSGKLWKTIRGAGSFVLRTAAFSPDRRFLVVGDNNGNGTAWDVRSGRRLAVLKDCGDWLAFNGRGSSLAGHGLSAPATLWDGRTFRRLVFARPPHSAARDLAFSADGTVLATADVPTSPEGNPRAMERGAIHLWNARTGWLLKTLPIPPWRRLPAGEGGASPSDPKGR